MTNKLSSQNLHICMAIITIMVLMALLFMSVISAPYVEAETPNIVENDPFYPKPHQGVAYKLTVPSLDGKLTLSEDGKTATLFAPYTTKASGWHDTKKLFYGSYNDSQLCWAASDTNLIAWYLDVMAKQGKDVTQYDRTTDAIFNKFRDNFARDGYDPLNGLDWYFTGQFTNGTPPLNLINKESGGYLVDVANNTKDGWYKLYIDTSLGVFGNTNNNLPFVQVAEGLYYESDALYNHESFSRHIIEQLHYGATVLDIGKEDVTSASHAITLWGADYDAKTGLVNKLYITDSDDSVTHMVDVPVKKLPNDVGGIKISLRPGLGIGDMTNYTIVKSSMVLYAPNVVSAKGEPSEYIGDKANITSVSADVKDITIHADQIGGESLEYGYSTTANSSGVTSWQDSNTFTNMPYGGYYFFARVKGNNDHLAGGISNYHYFSHVSGADDNVDSNAGGNTDSNTDNNANGNTDNNTDSNADGNDGAGNGDVTDNVTPPDADGGSDNETIISPGEGAKPVTKPNNNVTIISIVVASLLGVPLLALIVYLVMKKRK